MEYANKQTNKAFTLIELSIVVVIIGLIVAGVVAGQSLVSQAQLRTVLSDIENYKTSLNTFRLQYNALPGDMSNAQSYWSSCTDSGANLCNGDGDGLWENAGGVDEDLRLWQHLRLAGMVSGSYTGVDAGSNPLIRGGVNVPSAAYKNGAHWARAQIGNGIFGLEGNIISLSGPDPAGTSAPFYAVIAPSLAFSLDQKVDDGIAYKGQVISFQGAGFGAGSCISTTPSVSATPSYVLSDSQESCRMWFFYTKGL